MHRNSVTFYQLLITLLLTQLACNTLLAPRPPVAWDASASALIIEANSSGGMLYEPNAIPDARLWGDGRLVWVDYHSSGARQVLTAALTPDKMRDVLAAYVSAGFYGWDDYYSPGVVYDAPNTCVRVALTGHSKSVCESLTGAPRAFRRLYNDMAGGLGLAGVPFVPERGFLSVTAVGPDLPAGSLSVEWPATSLGLTLEAIAASDGAWLETDALVLVWDAANAEPLYPILHDGDTYYQAQLKVPGVTTLEPEER
jgi:hypothetical protein